MNRFLHDLERVQRYSHSMAVQTLVKKNNNFVVCSVLELAGGDLTGSGGSGLSVLRTFRLLRIFKLVRFMPNLRRQLFVMLRTMDNVAVFFGLLVLFIFVFR